MTSLSVGVIFITYNAKHHLKHCLKNILLSPLKLKVLVVNSSSEDGTVEEAKRFGVQVLVVPRATFNHGLTRERARNFLKCDIVVMMTPDAYAQDVDMIEKLIDPIKKGKAVLSYARQIPHDDAGFIAKALRAFNYPDQSYVHSIKESSFFCSNSCAAYLSSALDRIGGFKEVLLGEDRVACALMLSEGGAIAYVAEAVVKHSHNYSLKEEFKRNFDIGLSNTKNSIYFQKNHLGRGVSYAKSVYLSLKLHEFYLIPYISLHLFIRAFGYFLGKNSMKAPKWWKKQLSSQDFYW